MGDKTVNFSERLRQLRRERGLTQRQLADRLNVTYQAVSKWENGRAAPDIFTLPELASIFDCRIEDLFFSDGDTEG
jgi:transcriptional regulator with XRE-family HTH domain